MLILFNFLFYLSYNFIYKHAIIIKFKINLQDAIIIRRYMFKLEKVTFANDPNILFVKSYKKGIPI